MKLLITGSGGFLGRYVVSAGLRHQHQVVAALRPTANNPFQALDDYGGLTVVRADLRSARGLTDVLDGVDAVIHLAASKSGDFYTQFAGTVLTTENLLAAMDAASVRRLVGVSTFSVYDMGAIKARAVLDESSPLIDGASGRDEYSQTKLIQETMYRSFEDAGNEVAIVRPGMIYGRGELWHPLLGSPLGPVFLRVGSKAVLPMTYVENCADAIVLAAGDAAMGETLNIVDDDLPTQQEYVDAVQSKTETPRAVTVPWPMMRGIASTIQLGNALVAGGKAKLPGIVVPSRLDARFKPLRYSNAHAKAVLGWRPQFGLHEAIDRSISDDDLVAGGVRHPIP